MYRQSEGYTSMSHEIILLSNDPNDIVEVMGTAPSKTKVQPADPVLYYVRIGGKDVVTIDRLPTDTLANVRDEIAEEVATAVIDAAEGRDDTGAGR